MSETKKNVHEAFKLESQAYRKYLAFAEKAVQEGYPQIAHLFRAISQAEMIHACGHLKATPEMGVKSTQENLKSSIEGELYEIRHLYPSFIEQADKDGAKTAARSFGWALETEKIHERLYRAALESLEAGTDLSAKDYFICGICGYTAEGEAPEKCPFCDASKKDFVKVE